MLVTTEQIINAFESADESTEGLNDLFLPRKSCDLELAEF